MFDLRRAQTLKSGEMKTVLAERSYRLAKCMTKVGDGARPIGAFR